jgi:hypothetical protein
MTRALIVAHTRPLPQAVLTQLAAATVAANRKQLEQNRVREADFLPLLSVNYLP